MKKISIIILVLALHFNVKAQKTFKLSGENFLDVDSVELVIKPFAISGYDNRLEIKRFYPVLNGTFNIGISNVNDMAVIHYRFIGKKNKWSGYQGCFISPGEKVHLIDRVDGYKITGDKAAFFLAQNQLQVIKSKAHLRPPHFNVVDYQKFIGLVDSVEVKQLEYLKSVKRDLSIEQYRTLESEISLDNESSVIGRLSIYSGTVQYKETITNIYSDYLNDARRMQVPDNLIGPFFQVIVDRYKLDSCLMKGKPFNATDYFHYVVENFRGDNRAKLVIETIYNSDGKLIGDLKNEFSQVLDGTEDLTLYQIIRDYVKDATDGVLAYEFELRNIKGDLVKLSDLRGSPVLLDFWFTGCANCLQLAPIIKKLEKIFKSKNVKFVSISTDKNLVQWKKSVNAGTYTSPENINLIAGIGGMDSEVTKKYKVIGYPSLFLVDKNGKLRNVIVDPRSDDGEKLKEQINLLL